MRLLIIYDLIKIDGKPIFLAGTSASAPVFAGMLSTINAALIDSGMNNFLLTCTDRYCAQYFYLLI